MKAFLKRAHNWIFVFGDEAASTPIKDVPKSLAFALVLLSTSSILP
jgi:hypothetical protein